jgi:anti-sigma-K factor RskA
MTEQQQHLKNLLEQRASLEQQIAKNRELFWKVQGAIEYLAQMGVTLPEQQPEEEISETEEETEEVSE